MLSSVNHGSSPSQITKTLYLEAVNRLGSSHTFRDRYMGGLRPTLICKSRIATDPYTERHYLWAVFTQRGLSHSQGKVLEKPSSYYSNCKTHVHIRHYYDDTQNHVVTHSFLSAYTISKF